MSLADIIRREMAGILPLTAPQFAMLEAHYQLLLRWNARMNLTTVTELPEAATRHYCESLFLASRLSAGSIVDIGTGAGFPGIPIAVALPDFRVDLVESNQRKAVFLREATRDLSNVRVVACRGEDLAGNYDWVVSRAVDPAAVLKLRIARRFALLIGAEAVPALPVEEVISIPWGERRVLVLGTCPRS